MRQVFIHIGTRKSGTTSLQASLRSSREQLASSGYALPLIIHDGSDRQLRHLKRLDAAGSRDVVDRVMRSRLRGTDADRVLISNEFLAELPEAAVDHFLDRVREHLAPARIVVVITARPWSKVIASEWQERIKTRHQSTFADALSRIRAGRDPVFTARHDLPGIAERWGRTISADDLCVVAVPPPSQEGPGVLDLYCELVGLDPALLAPTRVESNQSLNPAQAELLRRVNVSLDKGLLDKEQYRSAIRHWLVPVGFTEGRGNRLRLTGDDAAWCAEQEQRQVTRLGELGCRFVGDPADLTPEPYRGDAAPPVTDVDVAEAAVQVLAALATDRVTEGGAERARVPGQRRPPAVRSRRRARRRP